MLAGVHPEARGAKIVPHVVLVLELKKTKNKIWKSFLNRLADVRLPVVLCHLDLSSGAAEVVGRGYM